MEETFMHQFKFEPVQMPAGVEELRQQVRTFIAEKVDGGWAITGTKVWTSSAHRAHYMIALARTSKEEERHQGLTQFIIDLAQPGIFVRPIYNLYGGHDFNEVVFDRHF